MWALVKAPTIRRSYPCKRFRQFVSTSPSRFFRFTAWMLPIRSQLLGLDRASTQTALERGSGQARQYQPARRSLSAQPVRGRRTRRHPLCQDSRHQASALGYSVTHAATPQGRSHRACQQACPNGLGHDGFGRAVQLSGRTEGLMRSRRVSWRDVKLGEGEQHVMQSRSIRRSGQPIWARALSNARF
jgi:hypothetical protein